MLIKPSFPAFMLRAFSFEKSCMYVCDYFTNQREFRLGQHWSIQATQPSISSFSLFCKRNSIPGVFLNLRVQWRMTEQLAVRTFQFSINQGLSSSSDQGGNTPRVPVKSEGSGDRESSTSPDGKFLSYSSHRNRKPGAFSLCTLGLKELVYESACSVWTG